jgi:hypothetical protein
MTEESAPQIVQTKTRALHEPRHCAKSRFRPPEASGARFDGGCAAILSGRPFL